MKLDRIRNKVFALGEPIPHIPWKFKDRWDGHTMLHGRFALALFSPVLHTRGFYHRDVFQQSASDDSFFYSTSPWRAFPDCKDGSFLSPSAIVTRTVSFTARIYEGKNSLIELHDSIDLEFCAGKPRTIAQVSPEGDANIVVVDGEDLPLISLACLDEWGNRTAPRSDVAWTFLIESNDWLPGAEAVKAVVEPTTGEATLPVLRVNAAARTVPETGVSVSIVVRLQCGCGSDGAAPTLTIPVTIMPSTDSDNAEVSLPGFQKKNNVLLTPSLSSLLPCL
jgi:hypothetical protein